ncbi:hypothetical protein GUITHDRAFT_156371 [Guillardia theta CCMP2712]|uniref:Uncharacterized protein n=1 Tax=Guillardia theta (strain CCMP2712) TaxID=905079 RepID=L1I8U8_GUITC|nr:hypothetical protein GUITHDRAFT_156371 [Guillardia theta CCMP2712]EKX32299.1 hypothetical protein GUITHDRAFT_156371 [Guillardia theta CCMP2712]|eukprot:XP_005819279.1 hypothetical protein GUITHDRAFT_156371 [Guillardia theta CCMP2712]
MKLIKYKHESFLGGAGWLFCFIGFFVLLLFFFLGIYPQLEDYWMWTADRCYVIAQNKTCSTIPSEDACSVSVRVLMERNPVCAREICTKRSATVYNDPSTEDAMFWLRNYAVNTSHVCYENDSQGVVSFHEPSSVTTSQMLVAVFVSMIFFVPACIFIPAFLQPGSYMAQFLKRIGIQKSEELLEHHELQESPTHPPNSAEVSLSSKIWMDVNTGSRDSPHAKP